MQRFTRERDAGSADELWLCEHPPVYTLGVSAPAPAQPSLAGIPVVATDRGGQITYHGPGQVIVYLLLDLTRRGLKVRELVRRMEQAAIELLADLGLDGERRTGAPGVYVAGAKIAALGLRVRQGSCYHGLSLNCDMDLQPFQHIDPCGYRGLAVTQLREHGVAEAPAQIAERLLEKLGAAL